MHNSKWQPTLIGKFNIGTDKPVEFVKQPVHIQDFWKKYQTIWNNLYIFFHVMKEKN